MKDLFISDVKVSAEHSDEIFKIFDGIVLKGLAFLLLIELISFSTSAFVTSLKIKINFEKRFCQFYF